MATIINSGYFPDTLYPIGDHGQIANGALASGEVISDLERAAVTLGAARRLTMPCVQINLRINYPDTATWPLMLIQNEPYAKWALFHIFYTIRPNGSGITGLGDIKPVIGIASDADPTATTIELPPVEDPELNEQIVAHQIGAGDNTTVDTEAVQMEFSWNGGAVGDYVTIMSIAAWLQPEAEITVT